MILFALPWPTPKVLEYINVRVHGTLKVIWVNIERIYYTFLVTKAKFFILS